jgi:hypothetical protein
MESEGVNTGVTPTPGEETAGRRISSVPRGLFGFTLASTGLAPVISGLASLTGFISSI